jgi:hypothetical protein
MKMATRRSSTQQLHKLFRRVARLEASFVEYSNRRHQVKDTGEDVYRLAYELFKRCLVVMANGRE